MIAEAPAKEENESMVENESPPPQQLPPPPPPCSATAAAAEEEKKNVGSSSSDEAGGISCLELEAWMRDEESMDCMMLLPEVPLDGDSPSTESMHQSSPSQDCDQQLQQQQQQQLCDDGQCNHDSSIFCRSSSTCSTTFPDARETLELTLPDDFFDDKQHQQQQDGSQQRRMNLNLPGLTDRPSCCDLKKIIVKKPVMDKAVERLGGGRRGALRLWNIIQVWLRYQQQGGGSSSSPPPSLDGFLLPNMGAEFLNFTSGIDHPQQQQHQQQQQQQQQIYAASFDSSNFSGDPSSMIQQNYSDLSGMEQQQQQLSNCSSAAATTRAARKSRMARQRRHRAAAGNPGQMNSAVVTSQAVAAAAAAAAGCSWSSSSSFVPGSIRNHAAELQQQFLSCRDKASCDKSVKFLLQKELKPSDVGNLGRIVLPKGAEKT